MGGRVELFAALPWHRPGDDRDNQQHPDPTLAGREPEACRDPKGQHHEPWVGGIETARLQEPGLARLWISPTLSHRHPGAEEGVRADPHGALLRICMGLAQRAPLTGQPQAAGEADQEVA